MKKRFFYLVLAFVLIINLIACDSSKNKGKEDLKNSEVELSVEEKDKKTSAEKKDKEVSTEKKEPLIIRMAGGDYGYPNPYKHVNRGPGIYKMELIYDSLLEKGEEGLIPWMSKSYEISEDGKEITFSLNDGIKWHDG